MEAGFFQPAYVRLGTGMAPAHPGPLDVQVAVVRTGPRLVADDGEQVAAGAEPGVDLTEQRQMLIQGQVDDGVERDDGREAPGFEVQRHDIRTDKPGGGHELLRAPNLHF